MIVVPHGDWINFIACLLLAAVAFAFHFWWLREQLQDEEPWMFYVCWCWFMLGLVLVGLVMLIIDHFRDH